MRVTKCDLCKKDIKDKPIVAGIGFFPDVELCEKCGKPIKDFLKKHNFVKEEKVKELKIKRSN